MQARFPIGTTFMLKDKLHLVTDIHTTYNAKMEIVKVTYVATHVFMKQTLTTTNILDITIAKNLILSFDDCVSGMRQFVHEQAKSGSQEIAWDEIENNIFDEAPLSSDIKQIESAISIIDLFVKNCKNAGINHFYWEHIKKVLGISK